MRTGSNRAAAPPTRPTATAPLVASKAAPSAASLDSFAYRINAAVFPFWTFTIIAGAIWAEEAWGRYWGWDPKEVWSFITWVIYAVYLHARATPSVRRRTATYLALAGWAALMFNQFGVNLFFTGLHSYSGTSGPLADLSAWRVASRTTISRNSWLPCRRRVSCTASGYRSTRRWK